MAAANEKVVHFVRHGQSTFNEASHVGKLYPEADLKSTFFLDADLTSKGEQQALDAAQILHDLKAELAITSPFRRALRTCQLAYGKSNVIVNHWCGERFESICDIGSNTSDLKQLFPAFDFSDVPDVWWYTGDQKHQTAKATTEWFSGLPRGFHEPDQHLLYRVEQFHKFLQRRSERSIAVFAHSMFLKRFLNVHFGRPLNEYFPNCQVISYPFPQE